MTEAAQDDGACEETLEQQAILLELATADGDWSAFLRQALKAISQLLQVERVSYWSLLRSPSGLACDLIYMRESDSYQTGDRLLESQIPSYVRALRRDKVIVVNDATHDPRTQGFTSTYFHPHGIGALLDVPVWLGGRVVGVLCHEHVGPPRQWTRVEQAFAMAAGNLVSMVRERQARRQVEEELQEAEHLYQLFEREASDYDLVMLDGEGRIAQGKRRIRGYRPEELEGKSVSVFYTPEDLESSRHTRALQAAAAQGRYVEEGWIVRRDGTRFWARVVTIAMRDPAGRLQGYVRVSRDLTAERLADERSRLAEENRIAAEQQKLIADTGARLMKTLDFDETLPHAARLLVPVLADICLVQVLPADGEQKTEVFRSDQLSDAVTERALEPLTGRRAGSTPADQAQSIQRSMFLPRIDAREPGAFRELYDAGIRSLIVVPFVVRDKSIGALTLVRINGRYTRRDLHAAEEIARRMALAVENARLLRQSMRALEVRDEFLAIASHELRTPLTVLQLQLQSVLQVIHRRHVDKLEPDLRRKLEVAQRQTARLSRLVDELLDVVLSRADHLTLEPEVVDLTALVSELIETVQDEVRRTGTHIVFRPQDRVVGRYDPVRLRHVLVHLLSNACRFGAGKTVEVELQAAGGMARLSVRDEGPGIAPETYARILEPLGRASSPRHYGGLGLGLFLSRRIVEAHGGALNLWSRPGSGTTVTVNLPLQEGAQPHPDSSVGAP